MNYNVISIYPDNPFSISFGLECLSDLINRKNTNSLDLESITTKVHVFFSFLITRLICNTKKKRPWKIQGLF